MFGKLLLTLYSWDLPILRRIIPLVIDVPEKGKNMPRIIPCAVCGKHLPVQVLRAVGPHSPELLQYPNGWFGILRTQEDPPRIGMVICCTQECGERLVNGTPVLPSGTVGIG